MQYWTMFHCLTGYYHNDELSLCHYSLCNFSLISYIVSERRLLFWHKMLISDNIVLAVLFLVLFK